MNVKFYKRILVALAGFAFSGIAGATSTYCTALYVSSASEIGTLNPLNGSLMLTPVTGQSNVNAVSVNPEDGYLYWVDQTAKAQNGGLFGTTLQYYYFNVYREKADGSGSVQNVGYINQGSNNAALIAGGFDASGAYYVMGTGRVVSKVANIASASGGQLTATNFTINSSTVSLYNTTNGDLAFDSSGKLWAIVENASRESMLVNVDPVNGNIFSSQTLKSPLGTVLTAGNGGVTGLGIDAVTGNYYISSTISGAMGLLQLDPSTGNTTKIDDTTRTDVGSCPVIPDLPTLSKTFTPSSGALSGGTATSALRITLGNSNKAPVYLYSPLIDTLPSGMTIPSGATATTTCTNGAVTKTANSVTLPAGTSIPVGGCTMDVSQVSVSSTGTYTNTIGAGSLVTSAGTVGTSASATFLVTPKPQLRLSKSHSGNFTVNQTSSYTLTVTNSGQLATSGPITFKDALPGGMQFVSASSNQGSISGAPASGTTGTVSFTFTPTTVLAAGGSATVTVNVLPLEGGSLTNFASVEGGGDPDTGLTPGSACSIEQCASDPTTILVPSGPAVPPGTWSNSACLDFSGVALSVNGAPITKSITSPEGIVVSYTLDVTSNVAYATATGSASNTENVLNGYVPGTWDGDRWDDYFGRDKTNALRNDPVGRKVGFTLSVYATYNSQPVPLTVLTGSAEDDGTNEYVQVATNGTPFAVAERTVGNTRFGDVNVSGNGQTVKMSVNSVTGNFLLIATTKIDASASAPLVLTSEIAGNGATAQGYCVAFPYDRGDAPASFGKAPHLQSLTFTTPLTSNTTGTNNLNSATFTPSALTSRTTSFLNGQPDSEKTEKGTTATEDADDALTTPLKTLRLSDKGYTVTLPYTTNVAATISGWIDFNGNGTFETGEMVSASVPAGVGQTTLTWTGIAVTTTGTGTFARFRIATTAAEATAPTGTASVGEVEDYPLPVDRSARLTFVLDSIPDHPQDFVYTATGTGLSNFTLDDDADPTLSNTRSFTGLSSGTYTVTQTAVSGWKLTGLTCTPSGGVTVDSANGKVTVALMDGADVTCTYTNTQLPNVSLVKYVRNTAVSGQKFSATSSQALPGQVLQYCIAFSNTGGTAGNFVLVDAFPQNTTAQGNLIYSAPATDLTQSSVSPTATPLPAGARYTATNVPEKPGNQVLVPGVKLDLGATGLIGSTSGTVCFSATVK